jgi:hypothetical protein
VSRVHSISPAIESGNVFLPKDELWAEEFIDQFSKFPAGEHDDMVDAASQALNWMLFAHGHVGLPDKSIARDYNLLMQEQERFLNPGIYDVYGSSEDYM